MAGHYPNGQIADTPVRRLAMLELTFAIPHLRCERRALPLWALSAGPDGWGAVYRPARGAGVSRWRPFGRGFGGTTAYFGWEEGGAEVRAGRERLKTTHISSYDGSSGSLCRVGGGNPLHGSRPEEVSADFPFRAPGKSTMAVLCR